MSGYSTEEIVIDTNRSVAASFAGVPVRVDKYGSVMVQATFDMSGGATSAGNLLFEVSLDGVAWATITGGSQAYTSATTSIIWEYPQPTAKWVRIRVAYTSGTGGNCTIRYLGKFRNS